MRRERQWAAIFLATLTVLLLLATALPAGATGPQTGAASPLPTGTPTPLASPLDFFTVVVPTFIRNLVNFATNPNSTPEPAPQPTWCCPKTPTKEKTPVTETPVPPTAVPPTAVPPTEVPTVAPTAVLEVAAVPTAVLAEAFLPVTGGDPVGARLLALLPVAALLLLALPGLRAVKRRP